MYLKRYFNNLIRIYDFCFILKVITWPFIILGLEGDEKNKDGLIPEPMPSNKETKNSSLQIKQSPLRKGIMIPNLEDPETTKEPVTKSAKKSKNRAAANTTRKDKYKVI